LGDFLSCGAISGFPCKRTCSQEIEELASAIALVRDCPDRRTEVAPKSLFDCPFDLPHHYLENKKMKMLACLIAVVLLVLPSSQTYAKGAVKQTVDVIGQGIGGDVVSPDGASIIRTKNGVTVSINMPTPESGSYNLPPANRFQTVAPVPGTPEVFTGWLFFFNEPENCAVPNACIPPSPGTPAPNDYTEGRGGAYNFAGHATSGRGSLNMVGNISVGETQFGGPFALDNPTGAEIHLAVAPHGVLLPEFMPQQFNTPIGNPSFWWVALLPTPDVAAVSAVPEPDAFSLIGLAFVGLLGLRRRV
jgi:hypothetical protein